MATTAVLHPDTQKFPAGATVKAYKKSNFPAVPYVPVGAPQGTQDASATVATDGSVTFTGLTAETDYVLYAASPDRYASFSTKTRSQAGQSYSGAQDFSGATVTLPSGLIVPADAVNTAGIQNLAVTTGKIAAGAVTSAKVDTSVVTAADLLAVFDEGARSSECETMSRVGLVSSIGALATQTIYAVLAKCKSAGTFTKIRFATGVTPPSGTYTDWRCGVWNSDGTALLAATANSFATVIAGSTVYDLALTSPLTLARGDQVYLGLGFVASVVPTIRGATQGLQAMLALTPVISRTSGWAGGTLPSTIPTTTSVLPWMALVP